MQIHHDPAACAEAIIKDVGKTIVLGLPLGLGKANHIANALYARAAADPSIQLTIFTALTLEKHQRGEPIARRLTQPIVDRLFGSYPELAYAEALRKGRLPANIRVTEFFLTTGGWLHNDPTQHNYVSINYTEAPRLLLRMGVNVIAQLVAKRGEGGDLAYSLSSNPDVTLEILPELQRRGKNGEAIAIAGQVNSQLPFMAGNAMLPATAFDHVLDAPEVDFDLFAPPKQSVSLAHHACALNIAPLIKDGGTLQIGIGSLGDAIAWALTLRHRDNRAFRDTVAATNAAQPDSELAPFSQGLYACTEMFVDAFLALYHAGILKRKSADGALLHGGFFLGPRDFYRALREMPEAERAQFHMTHIAFTNDISGADEDRKRAERVHACFINTAMTVTLLGEAASDTRADGQVVSGVGGQYNFVAQAHALDGGRSVIALNATRTAKGGVESNIHFAHANATIPRHLRDIFVTEYGVADVRGRSDRDVIVAMLAIADSRFQDHLMKEAKAAGKLERSYEIPAVRRRNLPEVLAGKLTPARRAGLLPDYPFGTDLTATEQRLAAALEHLKEMTATTSGKVAAVARSLMAGHSGPDVADALKRMQLDRPRSVNDRLMGRLLAMALRLPSWGN